MMTYGGHVIGTELFTPDLPELARLYGAKCDFMEKHWEWLQHNLDRERARQTIQRVDKLMS